MKGRVSAHGTEQKGLIGRGILWIRTRICRRNPSWRCASAALSGLVHQLCPRRPPLRVSCCKSPGRAAFRTRQHVVVLFVRSVQKNTADQGLPFRDRPQHADYVAILWISDFDHGYSLTLLAGRFLCLWAHTWKKRPGKYATSA